MSVHKEVKEKLDNGKHLCECECGNVNANR